MEHEIAAGQVQALPMHVKIIPYRARNTGSYTAQCCLIYMGIKKVAKLVFKKIKDLKTSNRDQKSNKIILLQLHHSSTNPYLLYPKHIEGFFISCTLQRSLF